METIKVENCDDEVNVEEVEDPFWRVPSPFLPPLDLLENSDMEFFSDMSFEFSEFDDENFRGDDSDENEQEELEEVDVNKADIKPCIRLSELMKTVSLPTIVLERIQVPYKADSSGVRSASGKNQSSFRDIHITPSRASWWSNLSNTMTQEIKNEAQAPAVRHANNSRYLSKPKKKSKKSFKCHFCKKVLRSENTLVDHIRLHTGEKPFKCSFCSKEISSKSGLISHEKYYCPVKWPKCFYCDVKKKFKDVAALNVHLRVHTGDEFLHKCHFCTKGFHQQQQLLKHSRIHEHEINPYKCFFCDKTFKSSNFLKIHAKSHKGERRHNCSICQRSFYTTLGWKKHHETHIRGKLPCPVCNIKFSTNYQLKLHLKVH